MIGVDFYATVATLFCHCPRKTSPIAMHSRMQVTQTRRCFTLPFASTQAANCLQGRFQHEDAVGREEYVVDLRGAFRCVQRDVVQAAVGLLVQLPMGKQPH